MEADAQMPPCASLALGNGAASPQGSVGRDCSSLFPQAVAQPDAGAHSSYLSH